MSSSLPLALAVLLGASSAARAADQPAPDQQTDASVRATIDIRQETDARLASDPSDLVGLESPLVGRTLHAYFGSLERPRGGRTMPSLQIRLGRTPAFGRSPGEAPPTYGELGIDIDPLSGLALVPSYRVILGDDAADSSGAFGAQILKLGVRMRF